MCCAVEQSETAEAGPRLTERRASTCDKQRSAVTSSQSSTTSVVIIESSPSDAAAAAAAAAGRDFVVVTPRSCWYWARRRTAGAVPATVTPTAATDRGWSAVPARHVHGLRLDADCSSPGPSFVVVCGWRSRLRPGSFHRRNTSSQCLVLDDTNRTHATRCSQRRILLRAHGSV